MEKIKMTTPIVEMDGDEMTRILWQMIKDELLIPFVDLKTEYYDLGLEYREKTSDQVTIDSAMATKKYGVAVKCATITPNAARVEEYHLSQMWKSPNGTIRALLDGTVFRAPIIVKGIAPYIRTWEKPITLARHAYGDVYKATEMKIPGEGRCELVFTALDGSETRSLIHEFDGPGIVQGMHNVNASIESFARCCFNFGLDTKQDVWFASKDTISKQYDHTFKDIFQEIFDAEYADRFAKAGITYFYTLIDDAVARVVKSKGGYIWACKNYDGDVMSDMVATAFGSLAMMFWCRRMASMSMRRLTERCSATITSIWRARRPPPIRWRRSLPGPEPCEREDSWTVFRIWKILQTGWSRLRLTRLSPER